MQTSTCLNRHAYNSCKLVETVAHGEYMRLEMIVSSPVVQSQDPFISYHSRDGVQTCLVFPHLPSLTWEEARKRVHHVSVNIQSNYYKHNPPILPVITSTGLGATKPSAAG